MKRSDFITIIKCRSEWKIDRRRGNYRLPNGTRLGDYIDRIMDSQMSIDCLGIAKDGNLYESTDDYRLMIPFANDEATTPEEQEKRYYQLRREIIGV